MSSFNLRLRFILVGIALCVVLGMGTLLAQNPPSPLELKDVLPTDGTKVDVMELRAPPRMEELTKRIQQAVSKNPDWWVAHIKNAKRGEPLPYDPRIGLTKEEYGEYLSLSTKMTLTKVRTAKLQVKREDGRVVLSFGDDLPGLEVTLDLKDDTVTTPVGVATDRSRIKASDGQKATGPWDQG